MSEPLVQFMGFQSLVDTAKRQVVGNRDMRLQIQKRAGMPIDDDSANYDAFCSALAEWDAQVRVGHAG